MASSWQRCSPVLALMIPISLGFYTMMEWETCGRSCTPSTQNTGAYIFCHYYYHRNFLASIYFSMQALFGLHWHCESVKFVSWCASSASSASVVGVCRAALRGFKPCYIPVLWIACTERRRRPLLASLRISLSTLLSLSLCCYLVVYLRLYQQSFTLFPLSFATPGFIWCELPITVVCLIL